MSPDELRRRLAALVASHAHPPRDPGSIDDETVLLGGGVDLDSLSLLDLVVSIDEHLGVRVATADVVPAHFGTFGRLLAFVASRVGGAAGKEAAPPD